MLGSPLDSPAPLKGLSSLASVLLPQASPKNRLAGRDPNLRVLQNLIPRIRSICPQYSFVQTAASLASSEKPLFDETPPSSPRAH